jgi:hypothetical protein
MLRFTCPKCTQIIECPDTNAGKKVACPICKAQLKVPAATAPAKAPARADSRPKPKPAPARDEEEVVDELEEVAEAPPARRSRKEEVEEIEEVEPARPRSRKGEEEVEEIEEVEGEEEPEEEPRKKGKSKARAKLGKKKKTYEPSTGMLIFGMVLCVIFMLAALLFMALAVINGGFLVAALVLAPLGIWGFIYCFNTLGLKVILHEGGLLQIKRNGELVIPWEDIEYVWQQITEHYTNGVYTGTTYVYTLQLYDGIKLKYTNNMFSNVQKLGEAILHETSQTLYPKALARFNKGKTVDFGTLGVSRDGLSYGSSTLSWREIEAVKIKQGYISVRKRGKWLNWCNIAVASIPNLYVFLSLVNQIVGIDDS